MTSASRTRSGSPSSSRIRRQSSSSSRSTSASWPAVIPARWSPAMAARNGGPVLGLRWARGSSRSTRDWASSLRTPVGSPPPSRSMRPFGGSGRRPVDAGERQRGRVGPAGVAVVAAHVRGSVGDGRRRAGRASAARRGTRRRSTRGRGPRGRRSRGARGRGWRRAIAAMVASPNSWASPSCRAPEQQVDVGIVEARHHQAAAGVDHLGRAVGDVPAAHGRDPPVFEAQRRPAVDAEQPAVHDGEGSGHGADASDWPGPAAG